jgi:hypothetical protein
MTAFQQILVRLLHFLLEVLQEFVVFIHSFGMVTRLCLLMVLAAHLLRCGRGVHIQITGGRCRHRQSGRLVVIGLLEARGRQDMAHWSVDLRTCDIDHIVQPFLILDARSKTHLELI